MSSAAARIPRTVLALGWVSLLTDLSSEMIYPLLPVFLATTLGAGALALGVIEGVAEATSAALKAVSGVWTDRSRRRKPLVFAGYTLSGAARPLIGLALVWPVVLLLRFVDRIGKGLRTSPRDALIADVTEPASRGAAYGFHRAMDHAGAVLGPLAAAALLHFAGLPMRTVFLLAAIPAAAVVVVLLLCVREPETHRDSAPQPPRLGSWRNLGPDYRRLLAAVLVFTLGNATDAFFLLRLNDTGFPAAGIAVVWSAHHVIKSASSYFGGKWTDKAGPRRMIFSGWLVYAAMYAAFGWIASPSLLIAVFLAYGFYFGLVEPAEKSWVASLAPQEMRGAAFGWYHCAVGLAALPASILFGLLWRQFGAAVAFSTGAALAVMAAALLPSSPGMLPDSPP